MGRSHPARQARVAVGVAGSAGFLVMLGTISQASTQILAADLSASLEIPAAPQGLDLQGAAVPGSAAADTMTDAGETPTVQTPAADGTTTTTTTTTTATTTTTTNTTPAADSAEAGTAEAPATTAPPETTTTTAPPQTDTTSSGS